MSADRPSDAPVRASHEVLPGLTRREVLIAIPATAVTLGVGSCLPAVLPRPDDEERRIWQGYLDAAGTRETAAQNDRLLSLLLHIRIQLPDVLEPPGLGSIPPMESAVGVAALLIRAAGSNLPFDTRLIRQVSALTHLLMGTSFASLSDASARELLPQGFSAPAGPALALRIKGQRERGLRKLRRFLAQPVPRDDVGRAARDLRAAQMSEQAAALRDVLLGMAAAAGQRLALDPDWDVAAAFGGHVVRRNAMRGLFRARLGPSR